MANLTSRARVAAWITTILLAGCGGGGGGSSGGTGAGATAPQSDVVVSAPAPASFSAHILTGSDVGIASFSGTVSGNVDALAGKSVTVLVEDPLQVFQPTGAVELVRSATGFNYTLRLAGRKLDHAGHLTGTMRILACLDTACRQPLGGTPLSVPYDVTVEDPLTLSATEFTVSVPFGTTPPVQTVDVGWSSHSSGYIARSETPGVTVTPDVNGTVATDPKLRIALPVTQPGSFVARVTVRTISTDAKTVLAEKEIKLNYTVTPSDVDAVVSPSPSIEVTHPASQQLVYYAEYAVVPNAGVTVNWLGMDYLSAAGTTGPVDSWWSTYNNGYYTCSGNDCLTPGVYTAQVRYRVTSAKGERVLVVPIRMTVTP